MKVLNWENDMIDKPEWVIEDYCKTHCKNLQFEMLSGLKHREPIEIIESIKKGVSQVVINPNMLDKQQIKSIVSLLGKGIYGYVYGTDLEKFVFVSSHPREDAKLIVSACMEGGWDENPNNPRNALVAILSRVSCYCYGFDGELFEITTSGWRTREFEINKLH